jgi:hypothetical protein
VKITAEMDALQHEVGRDQRFLLCRKAKQRAIISDPCDYHAIGGDWEPRQAANLGDKRLFRERHG